MRILVTNDDGVFAPGLWALVAELTKRAEVVVVAPDREQSGVGTSVTLHQPLRVRPVIPVVEGVDTYAVEGTPADSVIIALRMLLKNTGPVDMVISGINEGSNLGNDVLISGTVGAAWQAHFYGLPAIAISVASFTDLHFDVASKISAIMAQQFEGSTLPRRSLLNINVPNLPADQITGIEITRLGERSYTDAVKRGGVKAGHDGKRDYYWIVHDEPRWKEEQGTDIWALMQNKISITPLHNDLTNREQFTPLKEVCSTLSRGLHSGSLS
ncbi:MAG: 5'/3'-nucleotidase SurE [Chloroflexota bacterium]|nr:5'/3'-nucleotidase SurE [Chloroflexota bacterium]